MPRIGKHIYSQYGPEKMVNALQAVRSGEMSIREASVQFDVPKSTLADRVSGKYSVDTKPGKKPVIPGDVETKMVNKVMGLAEQGFGVSRRQMLGRAATVCSQLKLKNNFKDGVPGMDWLAGLRRRHPVLVLRKPEKLATVRSRMLNPIKAGRYFVDLYKYSKDLSPTEIWNMDETNLNMEHRPVKVLASVGARSVPGRTGNTREGVTVLPCVNAAGEKIPPLLIVRGKTERSLRSFNTHEGPPGAKWTYQPKGWMIDSIGVDWFREIFLPNCGPKRPQLIILDSHHSHETLGLLELAQENNIMIMTMPAHTTHYLCPLDRCVFGPFKREYDAVCSEFMSTNTDNIVNKLSFAKLMKTSYDKSFKRANIVSGFEATGIVDWNPLAIPVSAFATASAFDNPDIELDKSEIELPGDNHPLLWVVRKVKSAAISEPVVSQTATAVSTATAVISQASTPTHDFATPSTQNILSATVVSPSIPCPIGVSTLSLQVIPTYFDSPNHTGDHQNLVNFNDSFDVNVTSDTHPFLPDILSDNDAAEILATLTDSSSSQTSPAIVELESSNKWSGTWNEDLENIFSVKSTNEVKPFFEIGRAHV